MAYGLNPRLFIENGPAVTAAETRSRSSRNAFRTWQRLASDRRFEIVEQALRAPANDLIDEYPVAL